MQPYTGIILKGAIRQLFFYTAILFTFQCEPQIALTIAMVFAVWYVTCFWVYYRMVLLLSIAVVIMTPAMFFIVPLWISLTATAFAVYGFVDIAKDLKKKVSTAIGVAGIAISMQILAIQAVNDYYLYFSTGHNLKNFIWEGTIFCLFSALLFIGWVVVSHEHNKKVFGAN